MVHVGALCLCLTPTDGWAARSVRPAKKTAPRNPAIDLFQINRREAFRLRLVDGQGKPIRGLAKRVDRFFRCHHTNQQHRIDPRLVRLIYQTGRSFPGRRIEVISGYRHPSVARNPKSPHMLGLACDLRVVGIKNTDLRDYFRKRFSHVGIGYYPNSSFVHLDVRKTKTVLWVDYSGPGEAANYSPTPPKDVKTGPEDTAPPPDPGPPPPATPL